MIGDLLAPEVIAAVVALGAPVIGYFVAKRRLSGRIETSEAGTLWNEASAMRRDLLEQLRTQREQHERQMAELRDEFEEFRRQHEHCEVRISELKRENVQLKMRVAELEARVKGEG